MNYRTKRQFTRLLRLADYKKIMGIIFAVGGIILGLCGVSGWGWLIVVAALTF